MSIGRSFCIGFIFLLGAGGWFVLGSASQQRRPGPAGFLAKGFMDYRGHRWWTQFRVSLSPCQALIAPEQCLQVSFESMSI